MGFLDGAIILVYLLGMVGIGTYFYRKNKDHDDYYVGGRDMNSWHIGLSVVATDVGGGFSIGLGGLGFIMGISGSWMLFTGLIGAWLSAVLLIPRIYQKARLNRWLTLSQFLGDSYGARVALLAGVISAIGYVGFTSSQILAGAKLASATFLDLERMDALLIMGAIAVIYTVIGGLKAVIYTDTVQWAILMIGLIFIGIPVGYSAIGGISALRASLGPEFLTLTHISPVQLINWFITIVPIWFVGMTLYQRIYAARDEQTAKRAWFKAGLFEYPVMAFMGVLLGLFARVAAEQGLFVYAGYAGPGVMDPEMGLPLFLRTVLPTGLMGLMLAAYFSAIMSTADSCLMAASGNIVIDILGRKKTPTEHQATKLGLSQIITLIVGILAIVLAAGMENVLELMLMSYAFMVSGLLVPVLGALFTKSPSPQAAFWAMIGGGTTTLSMQIAGMTLPGGLDPNLAGITVSAILFMIIQRTISGPQLKTA